ncbi:inactive dipeptidyl peptidase 10-like [Stegodyphus dumicola]|uniref:inactive dipeptidyl peptidase 10-like n=1 Tax=Stegodyphus dumicola TaxID=202533 RepID=UPI0015B0088F|nr:inactive dipeptidyl peptidase 10-like [Stegodyphus dumicola]
MNERISLSDILEGNLVPRRFNGSWLKDDQLEYRDRYGRLVIYSVRSKNIKIIVENMTFAEYDIQKYSISADHNYVLLLHDIIKLYRYSFKAKYKIYDIKNKRIFPLYPQEEPDGYLQYATWGPTENQLVYVYENNVYYVPDVNGTHYQLSTSGAKGVISNGVPDWLYEEEILKSNSAIWWAPDGTLLCYATFNDTKVGTYYYNWFGSQNENQSVHSELLSLRYPKVSCLIFSNLLSCLLVLLQNAFHSAEVGRIEEHYIHSQGVRKVAVRSVLSAAGSGPGVMDKVYEQRPPTRKGWIDLNDPIFFGQGGRCWFLRLPLPEGHYGHYKHVAIAYNDTKHVDYLTQGRYDVARVVAYHEGTNTVFYLTTIENRPGERHLFSVSGKKTRSVTFTKCLTCDEAYNCLFNNVIFSPNAEFYILECLGPGVPRIEIRSIYNDTFDILDANDDIREIIGKKTLPQVRTFQVPLKGDYKAHVKLLLPPGFSDDEVLLYPLVVFADASPGSQLVTEEFQMHWGFYLAGRRNHIYAWIDGRGSAFKGDKMMHEVYYRLGSREVEDQIEVVRYLRENLPFIHSSHIAIWGWFYGGYVAASALADDNTVFKCAVSIAPVTTWLYYDSTYSERYMGTPHPGINYIGYEKASLLKKASQFKGKKLLLVHGTADDKVHLQHSIMFMKALIEEGVLFQSQLYPDEDHSLSNVRRHLYRTMEGFLNECFYIQRKDEYENTRVHKDVKGR